MSNNILINVPVKSVNGETGIVTIDYTDVGAAATVHAHSQYIEDADSDSTYYARYNGTWAEIPASSGGDMVKSTYDTNDSGVVDNAESLDSQTGSYYLDRNNHSGSQSAATITNFDSEVASTPAVSLNTDKISFPEAALDGNVYGRQLGSWSKVTEEAPIDGRGYIRKNSAWELSEDTQGYDTATIIKNLGETWEDFVSRVNELPKNLEGKRLVLEFADGDHTIAESSGAIYIDGFYDGIVEFQSDTYISAIGDTKGATLIIDSDSIRFSNMRNINLVFIGIKLESITSDGWAMTDFNDCLNCKIYSSRCSYNASTATSQPTIFSAATTSNNYPLTDVFSSYDYFDNCSALVQTSVTLYYPGKLSVHTVDNAKVTGSGVGVDTIGRGFGISVIAQGDNLWADSIVESNAIQIQTV